MHRRICAFAMAAAGLAVGACGFTGNLRLDPGFAAFGTPATLRETDRDLALSLGPVPLRLATLVSRPVLGDDEPWITDTLESARAVRVYIYELDGDIENVTRHIAARADELMDEGWHPIAAVREDGGHVSALVMQREPPIVRGFVVMVQDDTDLVLVNVIGRFRPESLNGVIEGLDLDLPPIELDASELGSAPEA